MNKLIFFGTSDFAIPILDKLLNSNNKIVCVWTQPPSKSKRGKKFLKSPIQIFAEKNNLNIRTPLNLDDDFEFISKLDFDIAVVVAYGQILSEKLLDLEPNKFINIHASILPKYRGAAPIQRSLINLDKYTGISFMKISKDLDSGDVCNQYQIKIDDLDNYNTLSNKLSMLASNKIVENLNLLLCNKAIFKKQNHALATYANKIDKSEGKVNWKDDAKKISGKVKGLFPYPGAWFMFNDVRYKILVSEVSFLKGKAGYVLDDQLTVGCGNNSLKIIKLQREGKKAQMSKEFLLGSEIKKGSFLE